MPDFSIYTGRTAWIALTKEDVMEPDLPICDPHHHLWDFPGSRYLVEEYLQDTAGHNVLKTVYCEVRPEMGPDETKFAASQAAESGKYGKTAVAAGIVGYADFMLGAAVAPVLEAHIAAGGNRFRGIRFATVWDASPELKTFAAPHTMLAPKFREAFACLKKYDLVFDAWQYHPQLMELVDLARAYPDVTIVVNHLGCAMGVGPYSGKRQEVLEVWKRGMAALATCSNVFVKVGGQGIAGFGYGWHERPKPPSSADVASAVEPYFRWCVEHFGPYRCMFESNFPVDKRSFSYAIAWNSFKRLSKGFSPKERAAMFYDTAVKAYRLA